MNCSWWFSTIVNNLNILGTVGPRSVGMNWECTLVLTGSSLLRTVLAEEGTRTQAVCGETESRTLTGGQLAPRWKEKTRKKHKGRKGRSLTGLAFSGNGAFGLSCTRGRLWG